MKKQLLALCLLVCAPLAAQKKAVAQAKKPVAKQPVAAAVKATEPTIVEYVQKKLMFADMAREVGKHPEKWVIFKIYDDEEQNNRSTEADRGLFDEERNEYADEIAVMHRVNAETVNIDPEVFDAYNSDFADGPVYIFFESQEYDNEPPKEYLESCLDPNDIIVCHGEANTQRLQNTIRNNARAILSGENNG